MIYSNRIFLVLAGSWSLIQVISQFFTANDFDPWNKIVFSLKKLFVGITELFFFLCDFGSVTLIANPRILSISHKLKLKSNWGWFNRPLVLDIDNHQRPSQAITVLATLLIIQQKRAKNNQTVFIKRNEFDARSSVILITET